MDFNQMMSDLLSKKSVVIINVTENKEDKLAALIERLIKIVSGQNKSKGGCLLDRLSPSRCVRSDLNMRCLLIITCKIIERWNCFPQGDMEKQAYLRTN